MSINIIIPSCDFLEEISIKYKKYEQYFKVEILQGEIITYLNFNDVNYLSKNLGIEMIDKSTNIQTWLFDEDEINFCFIGFEYLQPRVRIRMEDIELIKSILTGIIKIWKTENRLLKKPSFCNHMCYRFV